MARPKKGKPLRRVQLRIDPALLELFDRYTPDQLSELMNRSLAHFTPGMGLSDGIISVVRPPKPITATVCRLFTQEASVLALFPERSDRFGAIAKDLNYTWDNPYWRRDVKPDAVADRAAELGHRLLLGGFCVQVHSSGLREKVIAADYEPEHYRRVDVGTHAPWKGWFCIRWPRSEDLYDDVAKITAAKWSSGAMYVPPEHFREIQDFADLKGFWLSPEALALAEQSERDWEDALIICPQEHRKRQKKRKPIQPPDLSLAAIPDELRDDD